MEQLLKDYPVMLSTEDVAGILGVTIKTVRQLTEQGEISSIRVGKLIRIPKHKLIEYVEAQL